jgi:hypothetical protein
MIEPTPLRLLANILGRGTTPGVAVESPAVEPDTEQAGDPQESLDAAATKLQAHERGRQTRARARAQAQRQHTHFQNGPESVQRREVVADIAAIVGEVLARVDLHVDRAMATLTPEMTDATGKPGQ